MAGSGGSPDNEPEPLARLLGQPKSPESVRTAMIVWGSCCSGGEVGSRRVRESSEGVEGSGKKKARDVKKKNKNKNKTKNKTETASEDRDEGKERRKHRKEPRKAFFGQPTRDFCILGACAQVAPNQCAVCMAFALGYRSCLIGQYDLSLNTGQRCLVRLEGHLVAENRKVRLLQ